MILSLHLKKFRQHLDREFTFTHGLNVLRGPNESGKSTLYEAALYALYGAKSLREPLVKVVTWDGSKESELSVKLVIRVSDIDYVFTRSKAGAECNYHGGKVTGQAEVSAFAAVLLGADAKTAAVLMMSSQDDIRGVLDGGPAAVSATMGKLADFDMIDRIMENAAQRLTLGSTALLTQRLTDATVQVANAEQALAGEDPVPAIELKIATITADLEAAEKVAEGHQDNMVVADTAVQKAKDLGVARRRAADDVAGFQSRILTEQTKLAQATVEAGVKPDADRIASLRRQIMDAAGHQRFVDAYKVWQGLPKYPTVSWEGPKTEFMTELAKDERIVADADARLAAINTEVNVLRRGKITSGKCPTCGHDALGDDHVKKVNDEIERQVAELGREMQSLVASKAPAAQNVADYKVIQKSAKVFEDAVLVLGDMVKVDLGFYPPVITWEGAAPQVIDTKALQRELTTLEAAERTVAQAEGRVAAHNAALTALRPQLIAAEAALNTIVVPDLAPLVAVYDEAYRQYMEASTVTRTMKDTLAALSTQRAMVIAERTQLVVALQNAQALVVQLNSDITTLEFNNTLVGKLKKLKPMITDHLWNSVLAAVSNFFSTLRGEQSVVTKDSDGFKINGKGVDGFSGSTKDVLALAIRVALTKTFIPQASFIILDEPAHGCDNSRTGNVLGFLASVGFSQTLLASHDELSESVADNVVLLGGN